jgi:PPK2 family polyphosphate:nucleotide phosphotransferase
VTHRHTRFEVTAKHGFRLADHHPGEKPALSKSQAVKRTTIAAGAVGHAQDRMMAAGTWSLLAVFQGMDTSGKDGTIDHVFQSVNPAGVTVTSFKPPSSNERAQDFLWRVHAACPPAGRIAAFNRSHYEDVLVPRIHPEQLHLQHVPPELCTKDIWHHRLQDIENFERMLTRHGTIVLKFFLNISREEQRQRLLDRLDEPAKTWKFSTNDLSERSCWDDYMAVYDETIAATATSDAPWFIIPANYKWFARMAVAEIIAARLNSLDLQPPEPDSAMREALKAAKKELTQDW